jgi:hypothetical protein
VGFTEAKRRIFAALRCERARNIVALVIHHQEEGEEKEGDLHISGKHALIDLICVIRYRHPNRKG